MNLQFVKLSINTNFADLQTFKYLLFSYEANLDEGFYLIQNHPSQILR